MRQTLIITMLLLGLMARAEVLLVENFDYTLGKQLTKCGQWYLQFPNNDDQITISNGLEFDGYVQSGIGNGVLIDCKSGSAIPHIAIKEVTSGSVYVAMMIQATLPVGKGGWLMSLRDNTLTTTTYNENGRLLINEKNQLGASVAGPSESTCAYDTLELNTQQVYLAVLKYTIVSGANNDETSLYVLDSVVNAEPKKPNVGPLTDSKVADINPSNLLLRGFSTDGWIVIDGIRVATTWHEALGVEPTGLQEVQNAQCTMHNVRKYVENGRLVVEKNGVRCSVWGVTL